MEGQYGIAVTNKFLLLEEGEDILDVTNQKLEAQKVEKENAAKILKSKTKVVKKTTVEKRNDNNKTNLEKSKNEKNVRFNNRDNDSRRGRGGFRGRGRGRGGAVEGGFDRNGKRDFDRHSGNDRSGPNRTASKREGLGSHNWGSNMDELNADNVADDVKESPTKPVDGEVTGDVTEDAAPVEEVPAELSLNEYRALQKANNTESNGFKIRQAGEGVDNKQWEKTYILKKENHDEEEIEYEEYERSGRTKNYVDIEIRFSDNSRGRGGFSRGGFRGGNRGFRGNNSGFRRPNSKNEDGEVTENNEAPTEKSNGPEQNNTTPRGRGGRGTFRGGNRGVARGGFNKSRVSVPNVSNERDFPSLGA